MPLYAGYIKQVSGGGEIDNSLPEDQPGIDNSLPGGGGRPDNSLPSLPPDLPNNSLPPIHGRPSNPIYLPIGPENPIALPPGEIWPPLPPSSGVSGKVLILIYIVGVGYRWFLYEAPVIYPPQPPTAQPK